MSLTPDDVAAQVAALRKRSATFAALEPDVVVRQSELGELSFEPLRFSLESVRKYATELSDVPIDELPLPLIQSAQRGLDQFDSRLHHVMQFRLAAENSGPRELRTERDALIRDTSADAMKCLELIAPAIAFGAAVGGSRTAAGPAREAELAAEAAKAHLGGIETAVREVQRLLEVSRDAAAEIGISQHAQHFAQESTNHQRSSWAWLAATVTFALVTGVLAYLNYRYAQLAAMQSPAAEISASVGAQLIVAKIVGFSLLLSATVWCGRIYRAHRHNYVVNRHRQNALSSFEAFVHATSDEQTRNAVLLRATESIFAQQHSGFVSGEVEGGSTPQLIELVRTVTGPGK
jgi:hypothetical protein